MQPRFLFRRAVALIVDWLLVSLLVTLLLFPFVKGHTDEIRFSNAALSFSKCKEPVAFPQEIHDLVAPNAIFGARICAIQPFGIRNGLTIALIYGDADQINKTAPQQQKQRVNAQRMTIPISDHGKPVHPVHPQDYLHVFMVIVASAFFLIWKNGKTPGKALTGLRVVNLTRSAALKREFWRFVPFVVLAILSGLITPEIHTRIIEEIYLAITISAILVVFLFWYYAWPMIRWSGTLRHDKLAGTKVIRN